MPKIDPKQFRLLKRSPAGKISTKEITSAPIQVEPGFAYTVVDTGTGKLPAKLSAKRAGQDLQIYVDGDPFVTLEGFYAPVNGNTAFDGSGELFAPNAGNYESGYALVTGDALNTSDKVIVGKAVGAADEGSSWLLWGGVIGLGGLGAAAALKGSSSSGSGNNTGGNNGGNTGGNSGGNTGGNTGGSTGGNSSGGDTPLPPLQLVSPSAGSVSPDSLAKAAVQVRLDANGDGRIDASEIAIGIPTTLITESAGAVRGQFRLGALANISFDPKVSVLQLTSTGGTANVLFNEIPVTGPVEYLAYLTQPVTESNAAFQVVLSPLTTLGSNLFRNELQLGTPTVFNLSRAYAEDIGFVADALGVSMSVDALRSTSPERSPAQRLIAERQVNVLLDALVSLASGKSDASAPVTSANTSADMGYRLANYIVSHGGLAMTDADELRNAIVSVLPKSEPIAVALSSTLEKLMRAMTLSADGDSAMAQAAMNVLPQLSGTLAALKNAMTNGTLDDATVQSNLNTSLLRLSANLDSALGTVTPSAYARVLMTSDGKEVIGAFIDRNLDGQLNADDKLNGSYVAADFAAGKNADPTANRVVITYLNVPGAITVQLPSTLNANDRVSFNLDSVNFTNAKRLQQFDLQWSALDSSNDARTLKTLQTSGLKPDLSLTARGVGSAATLSMGKLGNQSESVTAALGAITIIAAGNAMAEGSVKSTAELNAELKGTIAGTARIQAAGMHSSARMTIVAPAGLETSDLLAVSTGHGGVSKVSISQTAADKSLKVGSLLATSHSADSSSSIVLQGGDGTITLGSQLSALAAGSGSNASIEIDGGKGSIGQATSGSYPNISAIATGDRLVDGSITHGSNASVNITSLAAQLDLGSMRVEAGGVGSTSQVTVTSAQGAIRLYGSSSVTTSASEAVASLTMSGNTGVRVEALNIAASTDRSTASVFLSSEKGITQLGDAVNLSASGANALAKLDVAAGGSKLQFDGLWTVTSGGYQSNVNVILTRQANTLPDIVFAKSIAINVSGADSAASLVLNPQGAAGGNISVAGLSLANSAKSAQGTAASQLTLVTDKGNFSATGPLVFSANGENSAVNYRLGTQAALDTTTKGDVSLAGGVEQKAVGVNSNVQGIISAVRKISSDSKISVIASESTSSSSLTFDGKAALTLGSLSSSTGNSLAVVSNAYGAKAAAYAKQVDGAITLYQTMSVFQAAQYQNFRAESNVSQIDLSGGTVTGFSLNGDLNLATTQTSLNASALMSLSTSSGNMSIRKVDAAANVSAFSGDVRVESFGFNSLAKLVVNVNTGDGSASVAGFNVDGGFSVISGQAGDLANTNYGARSSVSIAGKNATLHISGDLSVEATGDLADARADFSFNPSSVSNFSSSVDGNVKVSASGVSSEALLNFTGPTPVNIKGNLSVNAVDSYAVASFEADNVASIGGEVSVIAGEIGRFDKNFAFASVNGLGALGPKEWLVTAYGQRDIAVLDLSVATFGGSISIGKDDQIIEQGIVYLQFSKAMASTVSIHFQGVSTVGIAVPDDDLNNEVLKSSMLTINGFRLGIDKLHFDSPNLLREFSSIDLRNAQVSDDIKINVLIEQARFGLQGRPQDVAGFAVADIGIDKYIAYDLNGSGVTGLIKLTGLAGEDVFNKLQTVEGMPAPSLQMPTQNTVTTTGSIIKNSGDIVVGNVDNSLTTPFVTRQVTYKTDVGIISTDGITLTASGYRSEIAFDMSAKNRFSVSPLVSTKGISLNSKGLESQIALKITSFGEDLAKDIKIAGEVNMLSQGYNSETIFNAILWANENFIVTSSFKMQAVGYKSTTKFFIIGATSSSVINSEFQNDISSKADGFLSESRFRADVSKFSVTKNLSSEATGTQSLSDVFIDVLDLGATIGGDVLVSASGSNSEAYFGIVANSTSDASRTFSINGALSVKAAGVQSHADAKIEIPNQTSKASVTIGTELSAEASELQSFASVQIALRDGDILANRSSVKALGVRSSADLLLVSGGELISVTGGQPSEGSGSGNIYIYGAVSVRSDATDLPSLVSASNANASLVAYAGNVIVGSIDVVADSGVAHLRMQSGFNVNFGERVGAGSVTVNGATVVESSGAFSKVQANLISNQQTLSLKGAVRVIASGSGSSSVLNADSTGVEKSGYVLPQTLLSLTGNLEVRASGNSASASAVLSESGRDLFLSGGINIAATGDDSQAGAELFSKGLNNFVSTMTLSGGLALSALGVGSKATFLANNTNVITNAQSTPATVGRIVLEGPISLVAAGNHSVAEATVDNNSSNASAAGLSIGNSVTIKAIGDGSASNLMLSTSAVENVNESLRPLTVAGVIDMQALGADASATTTLKPNGADLSVGGVLMSASGSGSHLTLSSNNAQSFTSGSIEAVASGTEAQIHLDANASGSIGMGVTGGVHLIGSGDNSSLDASLKSTTGLSISNDIQLHSLGNGSEVSLELSQGGGASVSVGGDIRLFADSGASSAIGAKVEGDFTLGKLGTSSIDIFLNAVQDNDAASLSLKLFSDGGVAQLGGANQHGITTLNLGEKTAAANQLLDEVDISFTDSSGKAVINFGADQDATSAATLQKVFIKGFRLGIDEVNFSGLLKVATTGVTLDSFTSSAIGHFNTSTASTTGTSTATPVADMLIGGNDRATYIAYDYDGVGISAIAILDGISASSYKASVGLG